MVTPRLTAPQLAVLRALDAAGGPGVKSREGNFNGNAAYALCPLYVRWEPHARAGLFYLTEDGIALVAQLKAEGKL